ncbi:hypothetical protein [Flavobacterium cerinum]|uniref:Uncharacterized protein n=1 Tax=Flavobacterium cerinum TaxID=2502784 RepID=A0A444GN26_9FLAO|nr:hypothetical protein [Flavobacterium cerinum]RWW92358.1 hypothetical protein EPI11_15725 [Flavobacterium cerinum]
MRIDDVNINTSIKYGRILYDQGLGKVYDIVVDAAFCLVFPVISICLFFGIITRHSPDPFLDTFFLIMGLWLLLGWYLKGKLICIEGGGLKYNKNAVIESLKLHFPETRSITGSKKIKNAIESTRWGGIKETTILFDNENAYINRYAVAGHNKRSPFHAPFHYISLLRFKKALLKKITHKNIA